MQQRCHHAQSQLTIFGRPLASRSHRNAEDDDAGCRHATDDIDYRRSHAETRSTLVCAPPDDKSANANSKHNGCGHTCSSEVPNSRSLLLLLNKSAPMRHVGFYCQSRTAPAQSALAATATRLRRCRPPSPPGHIRATQHDTVVVTRPLLNMIGQNLQPV
jgi:hypothetical protein